MRNFGGKISRLLGYLIASFLALMAIFVFGNVILRYFFHSGWTWAEEISRILFIWLIFLGSILAFKDNEHLGVDTLVKKLSPNGQKILYVVNCLIILVTLGMTLHGSWYLTLLNVDQSTPALGIPYAYVYSSGIVVSIGMGFIVAVNLYMLLTGNFNEEDLVMTTDSEEKVPEVDEAASLMAGDKK